ncbi:MAG TPA: hypothetical protein VET85_08035 [Stellaceae bacterium]|nr:hypothetical protein [Stellaceae bacterium]
MQDFIRDWRRWTLAERLAAASLVILVFLGVSAALALRVHLS